MKKRKKKQKTFQGCEDEDHSPKEKKEDPESPLIYIILI